MPDADGELGTGDPRTLLRRGTGEGYAEVDFVGVDGRRYRARWEAATAPGKRPAASCKPVARACATLIRDQLLASQKGEYKTQLEAALGLNFEQFTRAVLLAQSEFSAFLKADDNDRSELLEKLTDTALYTRLGRRAFDKTKEAREAHKLLQDQASGVTPLAPEARAELDERFNAAQQQLRHQQAQLKQLELQHAWLIELRRLHDAQLAAAEQLHSARQTWDNLAGERLQLTRLEQLAPQRHQFARKAEVDGLLTPLAEQIAQHTRHQGELSERQALLEQALGTSRIALGEAQQRQTESAPLLRQAFEEQSHPRPAGQGGGPQCRSQADRRTGLHPGPERDSNPARATGPSWRTLAAHGDRAGTERPSGALERGLERLPRSPATADVDR